MKFSITLSLFTLACAPAVLTAGVTLSPLFSEHAILQRSAKTAVFGKAAPGEAVTVTFGKVTEAASADATGKWRVNLDLSQDGGGPHDLVVVGKNKLVIPDVIVGEVWFCAGQSNMEWVVRKMPDAADIIANSANPQIRQFLVEKTASPEPLETVKGHWMAAGPETTGEFTAIGYFFAKLLNAELKTSVGLVHSSWFGTPIEPWISSEALDKVPDLKAGKDRKIGEVRAYQAAYHQFTESEAAWEAANQRADRPTASIQSWAGPEVDVSDWAPAAAPGKLLAPPDGQAPGGAIWLRCAVRLKPEMVGQDLEITLGAINGWEQAYWNGVKIGETRPEALPTSTSRRHLVPAKLVTGTDAVLAVRIFNAGDNTEIQRNQQNPFRVSWMQLSGGWVGKSEFDLPPLDATAKAGRPGQPSIPGTEWRNIATFNFNGMVNPIIPYTIAGALWYQGEGNTGRSWQYRTSFPLLIQDWRERWGLGDFPFYFCQLANFQGKKPQPSESSWAELRDAQSSALSLPNTGMAVLIDLGEAGNVHPTTKREAADRLARLAFAKTYDKKVEFSGPVLESATPGNGQLILRFQHATGGLVAKPLKEEDAKAAPSPGSDVQGFAICGADRKWKWAVAKLGKDTVTLSSPEVPEPVAVRYAWADNPTCNLYNADGLPASPFRTDDFPAVSLKAKY